MQVFIDRLFLSWYNVDTSTAAVLANTLFWLPFALLFPTAGYVATFAAQYTGAGRPERESQRACSRDLIRYPGHHEAPA